MRTANPALNSKTFQGLGRAEAGNAMTIEGTVNKTAISLVILIITAAWTWNMFFKSGNPAVVMPYMLIGIIGGLVLALVTIFKKVWAPITTPIYSAMQGLALGGISAGAEAQFPGIVVQAVFLTFGTLFGLLLAYRSGLIKVTENFKMGIVAATGGIFIVYLLSFILGLFGINIPLIHGSGMIGILFSLFVVTIAALNLVLDFDFIEHGAEAGAGADNEHPDPDMEEIVRTKSEVYRFTGLGALRSRLQLSLC